MPAFQFDSTGIEPSYGGGASYLPLGKHPVVITHSELKPTKDGQGGFMAFTIAAIDGPAKGADTIDRLNLHNKNAETVRIANQQLAAYCAVTGVLRFQATEELHNKPFVVEIISDASTDRPNATKVGRLYDINLNEPAKAGAGAQGGNSGGNAFGSATGQPQGQQQEQPPATGGNQWGQQPQGGAAATGGGAWSQGGGAPANGGSPGWGARA